MLCDTPLQSGCWKEVITIGQTEQDTTIEKRSYSVSEIMKMLEISRKKAYELSNSGCFKTVRIGRTIRVSKASFDNWLDQQL